jgi:hypothetical protein
MKKSYLICAGVALVVAVGAVVGINTFAASKVSKAIDSYNSRTKDSKITGDVSANVLTSSISIDNLVIESAKGYSTHGAVKIEGVNFFDKTRRLKNDVTISYSDLTSEETAQTKNYAVSGLFRIQNGGEGDITFTSNNSIVNKTSPQEHFKADLEVEFSDTQDIFDKVNALVSSPPSGKQDLLKEMGIGLYLKAMQSQIGHVHLVLDNNTLLQASIREDLLAQNPTVDADGLEALYQAKLAEVKSRLSPDGAAYFDSFFGKEKATMDLIIEQKKAVSLLELTFKTAGHKHAGALNDYYTITLK